MEQRDQQEHHGGRHTWGGDHRGSYLEMESERSLLVLCLELHQNVCTDLKVPWLCRKKKYINNLEVNIEFIALFGIESFMKI